jgi:hypothetical protein
VCYEVLASLQSGGQCIAVKPSIQEQPYEPRTARDSVTSRSRVASAFLTALGQPVPRAALLLACAAALVCCRSSELNAQEVQLRPQAGLYLPTRISIQNGSLHVRQKVGVTVGARLTLTFNQRFDVVTGVTYMPGYAMFRGAGKRIEVATGSHVLTAATRAQYWLLQPARMLSWEIHTGLGMVFGGEPAYEDLFANSTVSGILGTTLRCQIRQIVSFQLRVQERLFRVRFGARDPGSSKPPLQISFGLGFPFLELLRDRLIPAP